MIYHQRDNERRKRKKLRTMLVLIALAVCVSIVSIFIPHIFSPATQAVGAPAARSRNTVAGVFSTFIESFRFKNSLIQENKALHEKLALYDAAVIERTQLEAENSELKALLGRSEPQSKEILATILSKPGYSPYDTLLIDAGEKEGAAVGDLVLADRSIVIGTIDSITPHSSKVVTYSSPDYKIDVLIGEKALQTTAIGKGGGNFEVKLPQNAEVKEGDVVMLASQPSKIFGSVDSIQVVSSDTFERVLFRSVVDINQLRFVTIEKP